MEFKSKKEKSLWMEPLVRLPGECGLDDRIQIAYSEATKFDRDGVYCDFVEGTFDYEQYWERQKELSYTGILIDNEQYIPGDLYFYLNFIKIPDKVKGSFSFPRFQDLDLWTYQEVEQAILNDEFMAILKARQTGFTLKFLARMIKRLWFEKSFEGKFAAFEERSVKAGWDGILVAYRAHLHEHTGWPREFELSDKSLNWKQGYKANINDRMQVKGNLSAIRGVTTKEKPSAVVSGKTDEILYDEAGISGNVEKVVEFAEPALKFGNILTGSLWVLGAAGETSQSKGLRTIFYAPRAHNCRAYQNIWSNRPSELVGFFVPYYYSYGDCVDEHGNSLIQEAKAAFAIEEEKKKEKGFTAYSIFKAQYPACPEDAFSSQQENIFPTHIIQPHYERLLRSYKPTIVTLVEDKTRPTGIGHKFGSDSPLIESLNIKQGEDKRGALVVEEFPARDPYFGLYYVTVDPVRAVKTTTSDSLQSVCVYKAAHRIDNELTEDKMVAWYCGRHDDPKKTYELTKKIIKWYNARAAIENDQAACLEWMQKREENMLRHLMKRSDMPILHDWVPNSKIDTSEYGFKTGSGNTTVKEHFYSLIIEYITEEIDEETLPDGTTRIVYGVERIKDVMLLKELLEFRKDGNFDRIISFGAALMVARANTNRGIMVIKKEVKEEDQKFVQVKPRTLAPAHKTMKSPFARARKNNANPFSQVQPRLKPNEQVFNGRPGR